MFRELDWSTPLVKTEIGKHWRILFGVVIGAVAVVPVWHAFFPNTMWFVKLWSGTATGSTVGMVLGAWWQCRDSERFVVTSGWFVCTTTLVWGVFSCVSLFLWAPDLYVQERERSVIRSLKSLDISSVTICLDGENSIRVSSVQDINALLALTENAELFYPSHEGSDRKFRIALHCIDGKLMQYCGRVPRCHPNDISIDFHGHFVWTEIVIPDGRSWLDSVTREFAR